MSLEAKVLREHVRQRELLLPHQDVVIIHSGNDRVGGIILQVISNRAGVDGRDDSLFLDFGALMDISGRYFGSYAQLPYSAGLRPLLTLGLIPPIPDIYREDLPNRPTLNELIEAWKQSGRIPSPQIERVQLSTRYLNKRNAGVRGVAHSHYHWDHVGNSGFLRADIPLYTTEITWAVMQAQEKHWGADWKREVTIFRQRNNTKNGSSYPIVHRPHQQVIAEVEFEVGGFKLLYKPVSHSALDSCAIDVTYPSGNRVHYTGDIRWGPETIDYLDWFDKTDPPAITFIDFTNVGSDKPSITEYELAQVFRKRFINETGTFFVMIPQRHFERLTNIIHAAQAANRKVYIPLVVAFYLWELQPFLHLDHRIPDIHDFNIYLHPAGKGKYEASDYPKVMRDLLDNSLGLNIVELQELKRLGDEDGIVLFTSQSQMNHFYSHGIFPSNGHYLHSASDAYDEKGVINIRQLRRMVKELGYSFNFAHASGHCSEEHLIELIRHVRSSVIIPIHTKDPKKARDLIRTYSPGNPHILWQISQGLPYNMDGELEFG